MTSLLQCNSPPHFTPQHQQGAYRGLHGLERSRPYNGEHHGGFRALTAALKHLLCEAPFQSEKFILSVCKQLSRIHKEKASTDSNDTNGHVLNNARYTYSYTASR